MNFFFKLDHFYLEDFLVFTRLISQYNRPDVFSREQPGTPVILSTVGIAFSHSLLLMPNNSSICAITVNAESSK